MKWVQLCGNLNILCHCHSLELVLVLEGLVDLHRTIQLQFLQHYWLGHRLGLLWYWVVCLGNKRRSFCHFWNYIQYCILDSFVDYEGYSISSKRFLPTVVDIMVIWVKFTYSGGSDIKASAYNVGDLGSIPVSGRSPGEGNGNPLQYSCLESPMDERTS